jgi:hypothetical protein
MPTNLQAPDSEASLDLATTTLNYQSATIVRFPWRHFECCRGLEVTGYWLGVHQYDYLLPLQWLIGAEVLVEVDLESVARHRDAPSMLYHSEE